MTINFFEENIPTQLDYTGLQLHVISRRQAEQYQPGSNEVCISIYSASKDYMTDVKPATLSKQFCDVLYLQFDDVAANDGYEGPLRGIDETQCQAIKTFVDTHKDKTRIVLHCFAGISRSRSIAAVIANYLQLPYQYTALNTQVCTMLEEVFQHGT